MSYEPYGIDTPHTQYRIGMGLLHWHGMHIPGMSDERQSIGVNHKAPANGATPLPDKERERLEAAVKTASHLFSRGISAIAKATGLNWTTIKNALDGKRMYQANKDKIIAYLEGVEKNGNA